ncbi:uncharacterized protein LOC112559010 [Pomacea canaliculata]|uniref:uncharacterized protein LOC112559010 n=1 Tax=Pomacea canaliculata TaxID=400727 RepID=UPI000D738758|nr:uncharacterized protein LOC112559010 [Pomacea canaliculata]
MSVMMTTCRTTMQASRQTKTDEPRSSLALSTRRHFFTSIVGRHKRRTQLITWRHKDHTRLITGDSLTAATGPGLDTTSQAGALIRGWLTMGRLLTLLPTASILQK